MALHFEPRVPPMLVQPHIDSILIMCDKTLEDFLGEDYNFYMTIIKLKSIERDKRRMEQLLNLKKRLQKKLGSRRANNKHPVARLGTEQLLGQYNKPQKMSRTIKSSRSQVSNSASPFTVSGLLQSTKILLQKSKSKN